LKRVNHSPCFQVAKMNARSTVVVGAILSGLTVALGAFGAHALAPHLSERALSTFETAIRYQMWHGLALVAVGILRMLALPDERWLSRGASLLLTGTLVFAGSLHGIALLGYARLGAVAPIGGTVLIVGWGCIALGATKIRMGQRHLQDPGIVHLEDKASRPA
jgi:uncharacterized membrane protein YgdD (TMEM256/DUF423 family)